MSRLAVASAAAFSTTSVASPFLIGTLATFVRSELNFDEASLGVAVAAFFAGSAVAAVPAGRVAETLGSRTTLRGAAMITIASLLGIALAAQSWAMLTALLFLAGTANGSTQPAANQVISQNVPPARQGLALGIKQSSVPVASMAAGVAVPAIGLNAGWRWAFVLGAGVALVVMLLAPVSEVQGTPQRIRERLDRSGDTSVLTLVMIAVATALGTASAMCLGAFLTETAIHRGASAAIAGWVVTAGSIVGICVRLGAGWLADRRDHDQFVTIAGLMLIGAVGFVTLGHASSEQMLLVGTVLAFGAGWGWTGLLFLAIIRHNPRAPAMASGITQAGGAAGAVIGPVVFGFVVTGHSYTVAWTGAAALSVLSSGILVLASRPLTSRGRLPRDERRPRPDFV